jgi:predicted O-linked N-acetylglucosamine transferase (SPINDLY family)
MGLAQWLAWSLEHYHAGRFEESARLCEEILAVAPEHVEAVHLLGATAYQRRNYSLAVALMEQAVALRPQCAVYHTCVGDALRALGRLDEASTSYRRALELHPDYVEAHNNLIILLDLHPRADNATRFAERRRWDALHARPLAAQIAPHRNAPDPDRRLRIGYVSGDFARHSVAYVFWPVFSAHDRGAVEVTCYSEVERPDEITARFQAAADRWRPTLGMAPDAMADLIRRDGIDVLVDLSAYTRGNRLLVFARKPAPVQVTAWGYATGTGLSTMDYFFADPVVVPPEEQRYFSEEVVYLPSVLAYSPFGDAPPPLRANGPFTFGSLNRPGKLTDETLALWARVLEAVPGSRLFLKFGGMDDPAVAARVQEALARRDVAPDRVVLRGGSSTYDHVAAYREVDIALDPVPHGGGVTTLEATWMGVPTLTLPGDRVSSRTTASVLTTLGLTNWIARSPDQYVALARLHAANPIALAVLRASLRDRLAASPICDSARYCRAVEAAYRAMWQRWCAQQPARSPRRLALGADPRAHRL